MSSSTADSGKQNKELIGAWYTLGTSLLNASRETQNAHVDLQKQHQEQQQQNPNIIHVPDHPPQTKLKLEEKYKGVLAARNEVLRKVSAMEGTFRGNAREFEALTQICASSSSIGKRRKRQTKTEENSGEKRKKEN